jgi:hypothetical protein
MIVVSCYEKFFIYQFYENYQGRYLSLVSGIIVRNPISLSKANSLKPRNFIVLNIQ